jgi:hypothetical protein
MVRPGQLAIVVLLTGHSVVYRILGASQVTGDAVKLNRMIERQGKVDVELVKKIMQHKVSCSRFTSSGFLI